MVAPNVKAETMGLMDRRAAVEVEMNAIISSLSAPGGPGISGGLVDPEVDWETVYWDKLFSSFGVGSRWIIAYWKEFTKAELSNLVGIASQKSTLKSVCIQELRNDHKDITNRIDKNLEILHSTKLSRNEQATPMTFGTSAPMHSGLSQNDPMEEDTVVRIPFAMIDEITDGSPSAMDGLQLGDEIVKFGNVVAGDRLQERLVSEALSNEDSQVPLVIIRQGSLMNLTVTPRKWHGRGLLGCHFQIL